jgi:hypothetical protein
MRKPKRLVALGCALWAWLALTDSSAWPQSGEWEQLFNGKDLTGWEQVGRGNFVVEDGMLKTVSGMGLLWYTDRKIGDSVVRVVFKLTHDQDDSGVFIRIPGRPTEPWMPVNRGYEVEIGNWPDDYSCTGVLYSLTKARSRPSKPTGEWNTMEITLDGPHTIVVVNGAKVTDYVEGDPVPPKQHDYEPDRGPRPDIGYIGLQNHSAESAVYFREVAVKSLTK